jgi:hypothetical protein
MRALLLLVLAQPLTLNTTPLDVRDEGARVGARPWGVNCTGAGVTCRVDGGLWQVDVAGGSGGGGKVAEAYAADAAITAQEFDHDPAACAVGQYVSDISPAGVLTCSTPSGGGGGGSANYSSGVLSFDGGYDAVSTVTAAWATGSSSVICGPVGEEASVEGLAVVPLVLSSGSFTVRGEPRTGTHSGNLSFVCTGN